MESKLLALRLPAKQYELFPHNQYGATAAVVFLGDEGGAIYRLDYYKDKHGDTLPRSMKVGEIGEKAD